MDADNQTPDGSSDADEFANAQIYFNEQLYEDAKKICRKLLIKSSSPLLHKQVRSFLAEIQKKELQDLLAVGPQSLGREEAQDVTLIRDQLEQDFRIRDLASQNYGVMKADLKDVREKLQGLSSQDMKDWGVAFLEMGAFDAAKLIFEELAQQQDERVQATYLLALTLMGSADFVGMTILLEPYVRDFSLPEEKKTDFLYLMGIAFEKLGEPVKSREYYRRVFNLNPRYRDVAERLQAGA